MLCGAGDRIGRLAVGCQADISLFSGHPLDTRSTAIQVFIKGKSVYRQPRTNDRSDRS